MAGTVERPILVVEDDSDTREAIRMLLETQGYAVATAANGQEALNYLRGHAPPRLILLDLMMPVKDGWQFLAERAKDPALKPIPVVVCSAVVSFQEAIPGAQAILQKPYDLDRVISLIQNLC